MQSISNPVCIYKLADERNNARMTAQIDAAENFFQKDFFAAQIAAYKKKKEINDLLSRHKDLKGMSKPREFQKSYSP